LFQAPNIKPLADKLGISEQIITAGEYKQMGTFTREWSTKERGALKELIDDAYALFITDVASARGLKKEDAKEFANARVFIAQKAKSSLYIAQKEVEKMSGVQNPRWQKPSEFDSFLQELKTNVTSNLFTFGLRKISHYLLLHHLNT